MFVFTTRKEMAKELRELERDNRTLRKMNLDLELDKEASIAEAIKDRKADFIALQIENAQLKKEVEMWLKIEKDYSLNGANMVDMFEKLIEAMGKQTTIINKAK